MLGGFGAGLLVATQMPFLGPRLSDGRQTPGAALRGRPDLRARRRRRQWELDALTKLAGQVLAAGVMVLGGVQMLYLPIGILGGSTTTTSRRRSSSDPVEGTVLTIAAGGRHGQRGELRRRPGRPGRGHRRDRRRRVLRLLLHPHRQREPDPGDHVRRAWPRPWSGSASASCRTTSARPGSSWATPARCCSGCCSPRRRSP